MALLGDCRRIIMATLSRSAEEENVLYISKILSFFFVENGEP